MVTNYPRVASHEGLHSTEDTQASKTATRAVDWLRQMWCGLHGHDTLLHFEHERMSLRCASCGHETPGWELNEAPPTLTVRGDARRHILTRPQLVRARRIA
jgi:hypothetical protein